MAESFFSLPSFLRLAAKRLRTKATWFPLKNNDFTLATAMDLSPRSTPMTFVSFRCSTSKVMGIAIYHFPFLPYSSLAPCLNGCSKQSHEGITEQRRLSSHDSNRGMKDGIFCK